MNLRDTLVSRVGSACCRPLSTSLFFMKKTTSISSYLAMIIASWSCVLPMTASADQPDELLALKKVRTQALESVVAPYRKLSNIYREMLTKLKADPALRGNTEAQEAVDEEIARLDNGENVFIASTVEPKIEKLREQYLNQIRKLAPAMERSATKIEESYAQNLYQLMNQLGAAEKLIAASETQKQRDQFLKVWKARKDDPEYLLISVPPLPKKSGDDDLSAQLKTRAFPISDDVKITCCWIKPGKFLMGALPSELGAKAEDRTFPITFTRGFWMARTETTQEQWSALIEKNPSHHQGDDLPIENIDWSKAMSFINAANLSAPEGYRYDLPSEAEWEYACRAGTSTALNSGKNATSETGECRNLDKLGWYLQNSGGFSHPVAKKTPNEWGLHDMHGNVWEWCSDFYTSTPKYDEINPKPYNQGGSRVMRGGSFTNTVRDARSGNRFFYVSYGYTRTIGFRMVVRKIEEESENEGEEVAKSAPGLDGETDCFYIPRSPKGGGE